VAGNPPRVQVATAAEEAAGDEAAPAAEAAGDEA
jgi:hypothetical protein